MKNNNSKRKQQATNGQAEFKLVRKLVSSLKPAPENTNIYGEKPPGYADLRESIRKYGVLDPLCVTKDKIVFSGNQRLAAAVDVGQKKVPCLAHNFRWSDLTQAERHAKLVEHNEGRIKLAPTIMRETLVKLDPLKAIYGVRCPQDELIEPGYGDLGELVRVDDWKPRPAITKVLSEHVDHIKQVVFEDRRDFWPLSVRSVFYALMNYNFLRNSGKLQLTFANDDGSYDATGGLLTRLRLNKTIPWTALEDMTRPEDLGSDYVDFRQYVKTILENLFWGYQRGYLTTQENYFALLCEKNTVFTMATQVTRKFQMDCYSMRGFSSIDLEKRIAVRFRKSRKKSLVLFVLSDHDPEGSRIPISVGVNMQRDFGIRKLQIVKVGVTRAQIEKYDLPPMNFAKEKSPNKQWYVERNGGSDAVWELEALPPDVMLADLEQTITNSINVEAFNEQVRLGKEDDVELLKTREKAIEALKDLMI